MIVNSKETEWMNEFLVAGNCDIMNDIKCKQEPTRDDWLKIVAVQEQQRLFAQ